MYLLLTSYYLLLTSYSAYYSLLATTYYSLRPLITTPTGHYSLVTTAILLIHYTRSLQAAIALRQGVTTAPKRAHYRTRSLLLLLHLRLLHYVAVLLRE